MHAAEDDDVGFRLGRFAREPERVADEVGDVLHFGALVVVRQDDRVPLAGERLDLSLQLGDELFARDDAAYRSFPWSSKANRRTADA